MAGDPRRPAVPVEVEDDTEAVLVRADGEVRRAVLMIFSKEDVERIRTGYCCLRCGESQVDHGAPFPSNCWLCGYAMQSRQLEDFGKEFSGNVRTGPTTSIEDELAIATEAVEREDWLKDRNNVLKRKPQIWVP
jgi:hypothetical protein